MSSAQRGSAQYGSLPFPEQIDYFRKKVPIPTRAWTDIYSSEHDHAFMVAGASKMAIVEDFQKSIGDAIENGKTLADFRRDFDDIVQRHGWAYKGGRNWRTRVIYQTNLRQSYAAGREAQMADPELRRLRPYGLYRHGGSDDPRPEHLEKDGWVVPLDDPWWDTWSPQNAHGCTCKKFTLSERDVQRRRLTVRRNPPVGELETRTVGVNGPSPRTVQVPKGIDPGFEHRPGGGRVRAVTPPQLDEPLRGLPDRVFPSRRASDPLPAPRPFTGELLPEGHSEEAYALAFLEAFGAQVGQPVLFLDAVGEPLQISEALFQKPDGTWKAGKRGRGPYMPLLAEAVRNPDEIWAAAEWHGASGKPVVRRRYVTQFTLPGREQPGLAVFEWGRAGWAGVTVFQEDDQGNGDVEAFRRGVRLYRRGSE